MRKDDLINNYKINKEYKYNNIENKKNHYYKYDSDYLLNKDYDSLSDVLSALQRSRLNNIQSSTAVIPINISNAIQQMNVPKVQGPNVSQPQRQPSTAVSPTNISNARQLWSPTSYAGVVYKYHRGVIGIELDGTKHEIIFDGTNRHHNEATAEIGRITNCPVAEDYANPFFNDMEVSKQGTIIIQLEGDSILVYLPEYISQEQYQILESEVNPRSNFSTVAFTHGDDIYDAPEVNIEYLKNFCSNIVSVTRRNYR